MQLRCIKCNKRYDPVVEMILYGEIQAERVFDKDGNLIDIEFICGKCRS